MRGQPVHGFRITEKRISRGVLTKELDDKLGQIERARKEGKKLSPSLLSADRDIKRNIRLAQKKMLLGTKIRKMHAVDKSALRRKILLSKTG